MPCLPCFACLLCSAGWLAVLYLLCLPCFACFCCCACCAAYASFKHPSRQYVFYGMRCPKTSRKEQQQKSCVERHCQTDAFRGNVSCFTRKALHLHGGHAATNPSSSVQLVLRIPEMGHFIALALHTFQVHVSCFH